GPPNSMQPDCAGADVAQRLFSAAPRLASTRLISALLGPATEISLVRFRGCRVEPHLDAFRAFTIAAKHHHPRNVSTRVSRRQTPVPAPLHSPEDCSRAMPRSQRS